MVGICCTTLFSCFNLAAIVTTAVYRFNHIGQLAALSKAPTQYEEGAQWHSISNERTYSDDAKMIIAIWFVQLFFCIVSFCVQGMIFKPIKTEPESRTGSKVRSTKHILYSAETEHQNFLVMSNSSNIQNDQLKDSDNPMANSKFSSFSDA